MTYPSLLSVRKDALRAVATSSVARNPSLVVLSRNCACLEWSVLVIQPTLEELSVRCIFEYEMRTSTFGNHFDQRKDIIGEERRLVVIYFVEDTSQSPRERSLAYAARCLTLAYHKSAEWSRTAFHRPARDICTMDVYLDHHFHSFECLG